MPLKEITFLALTLAVCISVGHAEPPSKIVNGQNADISEFPHQVSLQVSRQHICGGTILDATTILTAAHCVVDDNGGISRGLDVVTGVTDVLERRTDNVFPVFRITYHEQYAPTRNWQNDIAIVKLSKAIPFNAKQKPISLPSSDVPVGASVWATGWGAAFYAGKYTKAVRYLQKLPMRTLSQQQCGSILGYNKITSSMVCVATGQRSGVCSGDSGGPLTYKDQVVGVTSWVIPCGKGYPDVYTRVYDYVSWIKRNS